MIAKHIALDLIRCLPSSTRLSVLKATTSMLVRKADEVLPDRLAQIPDLSSRPVRAIDGTYQTESTLNERRTPKEGGEDNPEGHALPSFYNLQLGIAEDVYIDTRSRHKKKALRKQDKRQRAKFDPPDGTDRPD